MRPHTSSFAFAVGEENGVFRSLLMVRGILSDMSKTEPLSGGAEMKKHGLLCAKGHCQCCGANDGYWASRVFHQVPYYRILSVNFAVSILKLTNFATSNKKGSPSRSFSLP